MSGLNVSSIEWYFVDASGNKITTPSSVNSIDVGVYTYDKLYMRENYEYEGGDYGGNYSNSGEDSNSPYDSPNYSDTTNKGIIDINLPNIAIKNINVSFYDAGLSYVWYFDNVTWHDETVSWDVEEKFAGQPFVMYVGDEKTVTINDPNADKLEPIIGNSAVVSMETLSNSGKAASIKLKALTPGMTTLTVEKTYTYKTDDTSDYDYYDGYLTTTYPKEIWVAEKVGDKYVVPGLTDDLQVLMNNIVDGTFVYNGGAPAASDDSKTDTTGEDTSKLTDDTEYTSEEETPTTTVTPKSGGSTGTTTEPKKNVMEEVTPKAEEYKATKLNIESEEGKQVIRTEISKLFSGLSDGVEVVDITTDDSVTISTVERTSDDVKAEDVPEGQQLAVILKQVEITVAKIYTFHVALANLEPGDYIYWCSVKRPTVDTGALEVAATSEENSAVFYDSKGNVTSVVPEDKEVDAAVYLEPGNYEPVITTDAAGTEQGSGANIGGSGGGCNFGFSLAGLAIGLLLVKKSK